MKISYIGYFLLVLLFSCNKNKQEFIYQNPIVSLDLRDTHIVPYEGEYYAVGTCPPYWGGVNPGVKLYVSDNLQD